MLALLYTIDLALQLYLFVVIASVILSWLIVFNVVNMQNGFVRAVYDIISRLTEPVLGRIRRFLPSMGGLDLSPIVLFLIIFFLRALISTELMPMFARRG
jgi:YggT family protein